MRFWIAAIGFCLGLSAVSPTDAAEPKLLSAPDRVGDADRALVFVHGLLGSPSSSFGNWPQLIAQDRSEFPDHGKFSDFAIYAVDYEADFRSRTKLDDVAIGVSRDLAASQIFKRHRHVWFVAHSMGGLVLKRVFCVWALEQKSLLIDRISAVVLLGTPSAGAPLADLANNYGIGKVANAFGWDGALLADLITDGGSYLDSLETNWTAIRRSRDIGLQRRFTPIYGCAFETKPEIDPGLMATLLPFLFGVRSDITVVVPKLFTESCEERRGFPVKHTELVKPKDDSDAIHVWLRDLIMRSIVAGGQETRIEITTAPPSPDPGGTVTSSLANRVAFMNEELDPANYDRATGLPKNPERITFADDRSAHLAQRLVLRDGSFRGSTKLAAWQRAAASNSCVTVDWSPNRQTILLSVKDEIIGCPGGAAVCRDKSCN